MEIVALDPEVLAEVAVDALEIAARQMRPMEDLIADDRDVGGPTFAASSPWLGVAVERPDAIVVINPIVANGDMMGATIEEHPVVAAAGDLLDRGFRRAQRR